MTQKTIPATPRPPGEKRSGGSRPPARWGRVLERVAIALAALALSIAIILLLSGGPLAGRDNPQLQSPGAATLGTRYPNQGAAHLAPGTLHPAYDSDPPTSGPHVPLPVRAEDSALSDDQLLQALQVGDVVIAYGTPTPSRRLRALAGSMAPRFSPGLAAAGEAVLLDRRPGTPGLIALAWTRMLRVRSAADPRLREFVAQWLRRGAAAAAVR